MTTLSAAMDIIVNELRQEPYECADHTSVVKWLGGDERLTHDAVTELILSDVVHFRDGTVYLDINYQRSKEHNDHD